MGTSTRAAKLILAATLLLACDSSDPTECDGDCSDKFEVSKKALIGVDGGEVVLGKTIMTIPPGALTEDVEIVCGKFSSLSAEGLAEMPPSTSAVSIPWGFEPHGLTFKKPVSIELGHTGTELGSLAIAKLEDDNDADWEAAGTEPVFSDGKANFTVTAFSIYAVVDGELDDGEMGMGGAL